jgi:hypothetical protein
MWATVRGDSSHPGVFNAVLFSQQDDFLVRTIKLGPA